MGFYEGVSLSYDGSRHSSWIWMPDLRASILISKINRIDRRMPQFPIRWAVLGYTLK